MRHGLCCPPTRNAPAKVAMAWCTLCWPGGRLRPSFRVQWPWAYSPPSTTYPTAHGLRRTPGPTLVGGAVRRLTPPARPTFRPTTLRAVWGLLLEQGEQPRINELAALEEVLAKEPLLLEACGRCHDHKFDPTPTKDCYSL